MINSTHVAVTYTKKLYPKEAPFHPSKKYPEYPFSETAQGNEVYDAVRKSLYDMGLDKRNYGKNNWNPFKEIIKPGQNVVIKPNLVVDSHNLPKSQFESAVTHGSVVRPLIDYAYLALKGRGRITIADGPIDITDFHDVIKKNGMLDTVRYLREEHSVPVDIVDLRDESLDKTMALRVGHFELGLWMLHKTKEDFVVVDLQEKSEFEQVPDYWKKIRSTQLARSAKNPLHCHAKGKHIYGIAKTILDADCIINVPKMKAHKKTGVTVSLKNMIGITSPRSWMPHYTINTDEYEKKAPLIDKIIKVIWDAPRINGVGRVLLRKVRKKYVHIAFKGSNPSNDTLWRTILDLNTILLYADAKGKMHSTQQRKYLSVIDGIIAGEKDTPLNPSPINAKVILASRNPVATDYVATKLMGFNYEHVNHVTNGLLRKDLGGNPKIVDEKQKYKNHHFDPPYNWKKQLIDTSK
ncbi:DUF362 domain-containing protein [Candidatus Woesearchaeota archaeon]|nr:DUF362 domain-containing protein [Candidatus Woesearchaeota archaeon]